MGFNWILLLVVIWTDFSFAFAVECLIWCVARHRYMFISFETRLTWTLLQALGSLWVSDILGALSVAQWASDILLASNSLGLALRVSSLMLCSHLDVWQCLALRYFFKIFKFSILAILWCVVIFRYLGKIIRVLLSPSLLFFILTSVAQFLSRIIHWFWQAISEI